MSCAATWRWQRTPGVAGPVGGRGLVAFVADGSILPRESGISPRPMKAELAVKFASPPEMRVELQTPNRGTVVGMGIPTGVTLIVGGGYHGKSTLLSALEMGVYNHIPGDGREYVVSRHDAVKIRAEDGRRVERVDISPFISNLPFQKDTTAFSTDNASGSTSQAANIVEALEVGSKLLMMDEDTCATNFMIRDERMQKLVPKEKEPITPFIDQVQNLYREHGVSSLLVIGGSGGYFDVADTVIFMDSYLPKVVTSGASDRRRGPKPTQKEAPGGFGKLVTRIPLVDSFNSYASGGAGEGAGKRCDSIQFGRESIELDDVEQLVDPSPKLYGHRRHAAVRPEQSGTRRQPLDDPTTARADLQGSCSSEVGRHLPVVVAGTPGDYAMPRPQERGRRHQLAPGRWVVKQAK